MGERQGGRMRFSEIQTLSDADLHRRLVALATQRAPAVELPSKLFTWEFLMWLVWYTRGVDLITSGVQVWVSCPYSGIADQFCESEPQLRRRFGELLVWRLQGMTPV